MIVSETHHSTASDHSVIPLFVFISEHLYTISVGAMYCYHPPLKAIISQRYFLGHL